MILHKISNQRVHFWVDQCILLWFQRYEKLAKAQLKKVTKIYAQEKKKSEDREKKEVMESITHSV